MASDVVCVDEFPMVHIAKIDAVATFTAAKTVRLFGDARQIKYDPFCAEFNMKHSTLRGSVDVGKVKFEPKSHRLSEDACAMWLDVYPNIYPCDCCRPGEKSASTFVVDRVKVLPIEVDLDARLHAFKQEEKEEVRGHFGLRESIKDLRAKKHGGLATVHEDQGSTHRSVITFRTNTVYNKHESPRNPSLYNREQYVLTDTTRHTHSYKYVTICEENDAICKRVEMSRDPERRRMVRMKQGYEIVKLIDML